MGESLSGCIEKQVSAGTERFEVEEIRKRAWEAKNENGERWFVVEF